MSNSFERLYPNLAYWVVSFGWIELGQDDYSRSLIRILDEGGMVWESEEQYDSLDAALKDAEKAIADWFKNEKVEDADMSYRIGKAELISRATTAIGTADPERGLGNIASET